MKRAVDSIIIPSDIECDGTYKQRLINQEMECRHWLERPAYQKLDIQLTERVKAKKRDGLE